MKKILSLLLLSFCVLNSVAQANFKLNANGQFTTENGEDFIVVPFENKSAHEIYTLLTSNVTSIYNNASKVMNTVEDNTVKIRGFASSGKLFPYVTMFNFSVETYYQLEFKIRDGRVRVSAPIVEDNGNMTGGTKGPSAVSYSGMVQKHLFEKNGTVKKKRAKDVTAIETYINTLINRILAESSQIEEDW
ncbi:MAG: hypothetical protein IJ632_02925 [Muribaculaceae bacterium]|nr:hypothetical protein [Muribaculaceae bacterium]